MEIEEERLIGKRGKSEDLQNSIEEEEIHGDQTNILQTTDENSIESRILQDPICGLHYYKYLFKSFEFALRHKRTHIISWCVFQNSFILTQEMSDEWQTVASKIDMFQISNEIQRLHRIINTLNETVQNQTGLNIKYYELLCKEFNEFFDHNTNFSDTPRKTVKQESLYIQEDSLQVEDTKNALKWTEHEKDIFYEALARYGIHRMDEIADLLPHKGKVDVMNLYNALETELRRYKADKKLKTKLITFDDMPKAYDVSDEYIEIEEKQAQIINTLESEQYGEIRRISGINTENILVDFDALEENFGVSIGEEAAGRLIRIVEEYTKELMYKLYIKKLNEMTVPHSFEWVNQIKAWRDPVDPKKLVHVLNLEEMSTVPDEKIDFVDIDMSDYKDGENAYIPPFSDVELALKDEKIVNDPLEIPDYLDSWKIGITSSEVEDVSRKAIGARYDEIIGWEKLCQTQLIAGEEGASNTDKDVPTTEETSIGGQNSDDEENTTEDAGDLMSDVEDIDDLKHHNDAFYTAEVNISNHSGLFFEDNFIVPVGEDFTVTGNEYLQDLCDNETERMEILDESDSKIYELLLLSNLAYTNEKDNQETLQLLSAIQNEILHPPRKPTRHINQNHAKKFMYVYNNY